MFQKLLLKMSPTFKSVYKWILNRFQIMLFKNWFKFPQKIDLNSQIV